MNNNLEIFRYDFLKANTWAQRKDGVPLDLLDNLNSEELREAEKELIEVLSVNDTWPIIGLGYIKSNDSLPQLYKLLKKAKRVIKVTIAHSIFLICGDKEMIDIVLDEMKRISNQYEIIDILFKLRDFKDKRTDDLLKGFYEHKEYLVAYNAARALGLSTDVIVKKFQ